MANLEQTQSVLDRAPAASGVTRPADSKAATVWPTILRVAWLSIGLGLALEVILLLLSAFTDTAGASPKPFISDLAQKVSWSFIVCVGLAFGTTASKAREGVMGLLGLISAPVGFTAARAVHKAVKDALGVAGGAAAGVSPFLIGGLKGAEYAVFGALLAWIGKRALGLGAHVGAGLAIGLTFGLAIVAVTVQAAAGPPNPVDLVAKGVNEVMFPVGCALVLYASGAMAKRL
jgi:uncharacterized protein (DUF697 family)